MNVWSADSKGNRHAGGLSVIIPGMSRGSGRIERRIGDLFAATKDRALSVGEIAAYAFELTDGVPPDRKQRLSATRAAHRLLKRAAEVIEAAKTSLDQAIAETAASLGGRQAVEGARGTTFSMLARGSSAWTRLSTMPC